MVIHHPRCPHHHARCLALPSNSQNSPLAVVNSSGWRVARNVITCVQERKRGCRCVRRRCTQAGARYALARGAPTFAPSDGLLWPLWLDMSVAQYLRAPSCTQGHLEPAQHRASSGLLPQPSN